MKSILSKGICMARKWGRIYELRIESNIKGEIVVIKHPFTCEFSVTRSNLASANQASFTIYNLSESTRKKIFHDVFNTTTFKGIEFAAGYETDDPSQSFMPLLFRGNVKSAYSTRQGVNFKTEIECYDGGYAMMNGSSSKDYPAGTAIKDVVKDMIGNMPNIVLGAVGDMFNGIRTTRATAIKGNPIDAVKELAPGSFFIDNGEAFVLGNDEVRPAAFNQITEKSGLLGSPKRSEAFVEFDMIFEPRLVIGQGVDLASSSEKNYNGTYKVVGLSHSGVISGSQAGECTTAVSLLAGNAFRVVQKGSVLEVVRG